MNAISYIPFDRWIRPRALQLTSLALLSSVAIIGCDDDSNTDARAVAAPATTATTPAADIIGDRRIPFTPGDDRQFAEFFVEHHQMAIEMASQELERGGRQDVRAMAEQMVSNQSAEVETLRAALADLTNVAAPPPMPDDPHVAADLDRLRSLSGQQLDAEFLREMTTHHASALAPAHRAQLQRPDLQNLAKNITETQAREIGEMRAMLDDLGVSDAGEDTAPLTAGRPDMGLIGDRRVSFTPGSDLDFVDFFIAHHQMAIDMADQEIARGENPAVQSLAQDIKAAQSREIQIMQTVRTTEAGSADPTPMPDDPHMKPDMQSMSQMRGSALDEMFLRDMIPHHAAGMPTASRAKPHVTEPALQQMADDIFRAQGTEIGKMRELLDALTSTATQ